MKLVKVWNENRFGKQFSSYYVELSIMRAFHTRNQWGTRIASLSDAVHLAFQGLHAAADAGDLQSWLPSAPPVERGPISVEQLQHLDVIAGLAGIAVDWEQRGDAEKAIQVWKAIFGPKFAAE